MRRISGTSIMPMTTASMITRPAPAWGDPRTGAPGSGGKSPEEIADGFIKIAVENMANAIKKISVQRGYDVPAMR